MNILLVHPGANYATGDIYYGLLKNLRAKGAVVFPYAIDKRMDDARHYLSVSYAHAKTKYGDDNVMAPSQEDILYFGSKDMLEICLARDIDVVLVISGFLVSRQILHYVRKMGVPVGMYFTESPYDDAAHAQYLDFIDFGWTNDKVSESVLSTPERRIRFLPPAYDPDIHYPDPTIQPEYDVLFIGTAFPERIRIFEDIDWTGINVGLFGNWHFLPEDHRLRSIAKPGVIFNEQTADMYRRTKIGINLYRTSRIITSYGVFDEEGYKGPVHTVNPRAMELAACGVFTVSNYREHSKEIFGDAVPISETTKDMETVIRYYLEHEDERKAIAASLPALVAGRTFAEMADVILSDCSEVLS